MSTFEVWLLLSLSVIAGCGVGHWTGSVGAGIATWAAFMLWIRSMHR